MRRRRQEPPQLDPDEPTSEIPVVSVDEQRGRRPAHTRRPRRRLAVRIIPALTALVVCAAVAAYWVTDGSLSSRGAASHPGESETAAAPSTGPVAGANQSGDVTAAWVKAENARPGTTDWKLVGNVKDGAIEGFTDEVSVNQGGTFTMYVSTTAKTFHVEAYRMGYYDGKGGRLIWKSQDLPGVKQAAAVITSATNMVVAPWKPSITVTTDKSWPPGTYLLKLVGATTEVHHVPITVRDDTSTSAYLIQNSVTTWQAYNLWGGYDLYSGRTGKGEDFDHRAKVVSFDRPYEMNGGSGDYMGNEFPLVSLVESLGLDVSYWTDVDLDRHPELALQHKALISQGHDEYWSSGMRDGAVAARDHGVNIAFLGANAVYRHIRLAPSSLGDRRQEVDYKSASAHSDPLFGKNNAEVTSEWRDPPKARPESDLVGGFYQCNPIKYDLVIAESNSWLFDGTGLKQGDRLADLVGSEYDRFDKNAPLPPGAVEIMSHSPVRCGGRSDFADITYYTTGSGAGVIDTGTSAWVPALSWACGTKGPCVHDAVVRGTQNLLRIFGRGPAGIDHPSVGNTNVKNLGPTTPFLTPSSTTTSISARRTLPRSTATTARHTTSTTDRTGSSSTTSTEPKSTTTSPTTTATTKPPSSTTTAPRSTSTTAPKSP